jgi:hypothetical protein
MSGVEPPTAKALPKVAAIRSIYGARKCSGSLRLCNSRVSGGLGDVEGVGIGLASIH